MIILDRPSAAKKRQSSCGATKLGKQAYGLALAKSTRRQIISVTESSVLALIENVLHCSTTVGLEPIASPAAHPRQRSVSEAHSRSTERWSRLPLTQTGCRT